MDMLSGKIALQTTSLRFDLRRVPDLFPCTERNVACIDALPLRDGYDAVTSELRPLSYPVLNEWPGRQMNEPFLTPYLLQLLQISIYSFFKIKTFHSMKREAANLDPEIPAESRTT